jgi:hypothetical protein
MKNTLFEMNKDDLVFRTDKNSTAIWLTILVGLSLIVISSFGLMPYFIMAIRVVIVIGLLTEINFSMVFECLISSRHMLLDHGIQFFEEHFYIDRLLHQRSCYTLFLTTDDDFFVVASELMQFKLHFLTLLR